MVQINSEKPQDARYVLYRAGDQIDENGARSDGFYTIASGKVEITGIDPVTDEETSRVLNVGITLGNACLLAQRGGLLPRLRLKIQRSWC